METRTLTIVIFTQYIRVHPENMQQMAHSITHVLLISAVQPQTEMTAESIRTMMTFDFSIRSSSFTNTTSSSRTDSVPVNQKQLQY